MEVGGPNWLEACIMVGGPDMGNPDSLGRLRLTRRSRMAGRMEHRPDKQQHF